MKQIGLAFRSWAVDNGDQFPMQVSVDQGGTKELATHAAVFPHFQVMSSELSTPKILLCPNDEKRGFATNFSQGFADNNISYFLNVTVTNQDGSTLLSGDRNITKKTGAATALIALTAADTISWDDEIHGRRGNLGFADGSVFSLLNWKPTAAAATTTLATNWLVVP